MGKAAIRSVDGESLVNWEAWGAHEMAGTSVAKHSQNQDTLFPFPSFCEEWRTMARGKKETWSLVLLKAAPGSVHWDSRGLQMMWEVHCHLDEGRGQHHPPSRSRLAELILTRWKIYPCCSRKPQSCLSLPQCGQKAQQELFASAWGWTGEQFKYAEVGDLGGGRGVGREAESKSWSSIQELRQRQLSAEWGTEVVPASKLQNPMEKIKINHTTPSESLTWQEWIRVISVGLGDLTWGFKWVPTSTWRQHLLQVP